MREKKVEPMEKSSPIRKTFIGLSESFFPKFSTFFSRNFSIFHIFLGFFSPNIGMLTNLIFLLLENFTNSDSTPPYIDAYLSAINYFQTLEFLEKTLSDKNELNISNYFQTLQIMEKKLSFYWNVNELDIFGSGEFHE